MDSDDSIGSNERPSQRWFRFSLLGLFLFMTLICVLLGWWVQPRRYIVESVFYLNARQPDLLGDSPAAFDPQEFALLRKTQSDYVRSDLVLLSALRDPSIAALPVLRSRSDPVDWLRGHLEVATSADSELLSIRMRCAEGVLDDYRQIVDAVSDAYVKEALFKESQQRQQRRDMFSKSISELRDDLAKRISALQDRTANADTSDPARDVAQLEIDTKRDVLRELIHQFEVEKVNGMTYSRIRLVQRAISRPE